MAATIETIPFAGSGRGCYLLFEVANQGTLFTIWSEEGVEYAPGYIAFFTPTKVVPRFKFNSGGKSELSRGFQGNRARFMQGICQFMTQAKEFGGTCTLLTPTIAVFLRKETSGEIVKMNDSGEVEPVTMSEFNAVVVVNASNDSLNSGISMMREPFVRVGLNDGWGLYI